MKSYIILTLVLWAAVNCASLKLGRIIGGHDAEVGEAPYIVQIRADKPYCAGALISPNWVLTAGHCLELESFSVLAGLHAANGTNDPEVQFRQIPSSKHYVIHKYYSEALDSVDLGLIYIAQPFDVEKSPRVKTIALATGNYAEGTQGKLYGWGKMEGDVHPTNLRVVDVSISSYERCWDYYPHFAPLMIYNICTEGPIGSCDGDSGGPLIHNTPDGVELVGILSFNGVPCDDKIRNPSVYINVAMFPQWISNTTRDFVVPS